MPARWQDLKELRRLEKICFNALPATFSPDMWSHQYDQQVNQVECSIKERKWTTNGPESNIYGLEPNYGCCTSDLSQGWPKFAAHLWMRKDDGLAAVAYAPCLVKTKINGANVQVRVKTEYPFRDRIEFSVTVDKPTGFGLYLRIPAWSPEATIVMDGKSIKASGGSFHKIERKWSKKTTIVLTLPAEPQIVRGYNNSVAIQRGPLIFALKIGEKWVAVNQDKPGREMPHGDWEVYPTSAWNYALLRALKLSLLFYYRKGMITDTRKSFLSIYGKNQKQFVDKLYKIYEYDKSLKRKRKRK